MAKGAPELARDMTMDELMRRWPVSATVVLGRRMLCVGCPIAPFHSIADACEEHAVDEGEFLAELERALDEGSGFPALGNHA